MTLKIYTSKSAVSVRVQLGGGLSALVTFAPQIEGGSKFETTDASLQSALEAHNKYGKLFTLDSSAESEDSVTLPKVQYYSSDEPDGHAVRYTPQTLTEPEREQARENIGASATPEELQKVLRYVPQTLTGEEQAQARENIGVEAAIARAINNAKEEVTVTATADIGSVSSLAELTVKVGGEVVATGTGTLTVRVGDRTLRELTAADGESALKFNTTGLSTAVVCAYTPGENETGGAYVSSVAVTDGMFIIFR